MPDNKGKKTKIANNSISPSEPDPIEHSQVGLMVPGESMVGNSVIIGNYSNILPAVVNVVEAL